MNLEVCQRRCDGRSQGGSAEFLYHNLRPVLAYLGDLEPRQS